jgi:hypothetical protein
MKQKEVKLNQIAVGQILSTKKFRTGLCEIAFSS